MLFFSPSSVIESPLSLLRFRLTEIYISSAFLSLFFFAVADDDDCLLIAVVTVVAVVKVLAVVVFWFSVIVVGVCFFKGVLFFLPHFVTWVQPSSSLS